MVSNNSLDSHLTLCLLGRVTTRRGGPSCADTGMKSGCTQTITQVCAVPTTVCSGASHTVPTAISGPELLGTNIPLICCWQCRRSSWAKLHLFLVQWSTICLRGHLLKKLTPNAHCADKFVPRNYTEPHWTASLTAGSSSYLYRYVLSSDIKGKNLHTFKSTMYVGGHTHTHTHMCIHIHTWTHTHTQGHTHTLLTSSLPTKLHHPCPFVLGMHASPPMQIKGKLLPIIKDSCVHLCNRLKKNTIDSSSNKTALKNIYQTT